MNAKAWRLIADINNWTQKANARDKNDKRVLPNDPTAVKWDAQGAIHVVYPKEQVQSQINKLRAEVGTPFLAEWNDQFKMNPSGQHKQVVATLRKLGI